MASLLDSTSMFTESEPPKTVNQTYYTWQPSSDPEDPGEERITRQRQVTNPAWSSWNKRKQDFEANAKDGVGIDWPIRYNDIKKWYDHVENFIGVSGMKENLSQLPDAQFLPPMEMNCVELEVKKNIENKFP